MSSVNLNLHRETILAAAVKIGGALGDDAVTRERVAGELGVADISEHFATDAALVDAIEPYLKERKARFITQALSEAPHVDTPFDKFVALGDSYLAYVQQDPDMFHYLFEVHSGLTSQQLHSARAGHLIDNKSFNVLLSVLRDLADEAGTDVCPDEIFDAGMAAWAAAHGSAHLSTLGVLRHQHAVVRRYNFDTIIKSFGHAAVERFKSGKSHQPPQLYARLRPVIEAYSASLPDYSDVVVSADMGDNLLRKVALEKAIDIAGTDGPSALKIARLTAELNLSPERLLQAIESEFALREEAETVTDVEVLNYINAIMDALPADASADDRLRAMAVAYFQYAVYDPSRFNSMIALGTKSVVPSSVEGHEGQMGVAFKALQDLCCEAISELSASAAPSGTVGAAQPVSAVNDAKNEWQIYIKTLMLWAGANGIAHLCALADLRGLTLDEKWRLLEETFEYVIASFEYGSAN